MDLSSRKVQVEIDEQKAKPGADLVHRVAAKKPLASQEIAFWT